MTGQSLDAICAGPDAGRVALIVPGEAPITFGRLADTVSSMAGALSQVGVARGDRVCVALPNGPEIVAVILAAGLLGAAAAPLNPAYTADEFAFFLRDLRPRLLVLAPDDAGPVGAAASTNTPIARLRMGPEIGFAHLTGRAADPVAEPGDTALLLHTSGTTGRPKQVPLLQSNLMASAHSIARHYQLEPTDVSLVAMPLFHIHGLVASVVAPLLVGGCAVIPRRLTGRGFAELLSEYGVTWFSAGPTVHHMLLERMPPQLGERVRLRFTRSCSSALSPNLLARAESVYGAPMLEAYGMTEASHEMAANPLPPRERRPGTVGVPTGAVLRIIDPATRVDAPPGQGGEVEVRGPGVMPGYVADEGVNDEAFHDGWFRTGDVGVLDDGYLTLVGRVKEIIIRGGENIAPAEVEAILLRHPAVADVAVFGVEDDKYGEIVAAAVALLTPVRETELIDHCRQYLTSVKVPAVIHILEAISRTPTGKLQRRRIAAEIYGD